MLTAVGEVAMVAIDCDHTLLSDEWQIGGASRAAIRRLAQHGVAIVLASGRMPGAIEPLISELEVEACVVAYNGALARDPADRQWVWRRPIASEAAESVLRLAEEHELGRMFFVGDELFVDREDAVVREYRRRTGVSARMVGSVDRLVETGLLKMILYDPSFASRRGRALDGESRLLDLLAAASGVQAFGTSYGYVELGSLGTSKLQALDALASRRGLGRRHVVAIGDGPNDVEMIRHCELGVAVANACAEALAAADLVVRSNNEDGVGEALEYLLEG